MNVGRLSGMFEESAGKRAALITYATGYYPDREGSAHVIRAMLESGADAVEIGLPFSDPVMDGPVIQETSRAALDSGSTTAGVLGLVSEIRGETDKPLVIMSYYNPVFHYGLARFASDAADAGVDGVVIPDLPAEEMGPWKRESDSAGLETVAFCSVTTSERRIELASRMSTGFLYCIPVLGTTGSRESVPDELPRFIKRVREHATCPVVVGVGISTPDHCREVGALADGVIVGSALMREVMSGEGAVDVGAAVRRFAESLRPGA